MQPRFVIAACAALSLAFGPTATLRADQADDQYRLAAVHYQHKRWDLAAAEFRTFLKDHPRDTRSDQAQFYLGEALVQLRDFSSAAQHFAAAQRSTSADLARKALFRTGEAQYLAGRSVDAERELEKFCERFLHDKLAPFAFAYRGEMALAGERIDDAEHHFRQALDGDLTGPLADDCRLGLAEVWQRQRRPDDARQLLTNLVAGGGAKAPEAHFRLALYAYAAADYQAADQEFALCASMAGDASDDHAPAAQQSLGDRARLGRARSLYHLKKYDEAIAALDPLTDHGLLRGEARYWLGLTRKAQGNLDAAAPLLSAAADAATTAERQSAALAELATCYAAAKHFDKARTAYKSFLDAHPGDELRLTTTEILADTALEHQETSWASALYESLSHEESFADPAARGLLGLARAQLAADHANDAATTLVRLTERYPQAPCAAEAELLRGQILEQLDRPDEALATYAAVVKNHEARPEADDALARSAQICVSLKRFADAGKYYQKLLARPAHKPDGDAILYRWACAELRAEKQDAGHDLLARLRSEYPDSEFFAEATCRLAQEEIQKRQYDRADELLESLDDKSLTADVQARWLFLRGQSAAAQEKWPAVAAPLEKLIASDRNSPLRAAAEYWIAEAAYHQEQFEDAARRFAALDERLSGDAADQAAPWRAMIPLRRAQIYAHAGQWTEALDMAEALTRQFPDFPQQYEADYIVGRAHAARAEFDEARQAYRRVLTSPTGRKSETGAMAQWMIGETYMHQRDYRAALAEYLKVEILHAFPHWQAAALLQAGKCQEQLKRPGEAAATYQRLLREFPDTNFDQEAALRLAKLRR
ncbi:MAG TPA: tetratricopeptide repeat protein [Pirellulales bacterium]|nr:tetratricopeptide repeat protein [Pirellulales bacterium]